MSKAERNVEMLNQLTLGRGKIFVAGRYIGNSPSFEFLPPKGDGRMRIRFVTDNISEENLLMYFKAQLLRPDERVQVTYQANNPAGRNIDFEFPCVKLEADGFQLKGDDWQGIAIVGVLHLDMKGDLFRYTIPTVHSFPGDRPASWDLAESVEGFVAGRPVTGDTDNG